MNPTHLFMHPSDMSLCGEQVRPQISRREPHPEDVPMVVHFLNVCPTCLKILEVGVVDEGNNRVAIVSNFLKDRLVRV